MSASINIKMYRVGELGDCFLLTLKNDATVRHVLIDCGSFRNSTKSIARMKQIAADIKKQLGAGVKLDVAAGTHQHNDHVSGFVHAEQDFRAIGVKQVWLSWLDDPKNKIATRIGDNHLKLRKTLKEISAKLDKLQQKKAGKNGASLSVKKISNTKDVVDGLLSFFGAAPELPAKGIEILKEIGDKQVDYLEPGFIRTVEGISSDAIRVFVLGPPTNEALLYRKDPRKGESYDMRMNAMASMADHFLNALDKRTSNDGKGEEQFPFNVTFKRALRKRGTFSADLKVVAKQYADPANAWRNIDDDWLDQASRLALYMDDFTNNSSLVLAFELVRSGKVLLFAADAQTGNWISWDKLKYKDKSVTTESLFERTVFYKVGHHGSENATLKPSMEKMTNPELVAMIPVDKTDANITKANGWKMPAKNLNQALKDKTNYRVLRMDDGFAEDCDPTKDAKAKAGWKKIKNQPSIKPLYIEYTVTD